MRELWLERSIGECLRMEFAGEWGSEPRNAGNANVLRSTDIDDEGHLLGAGASRSIHRKKLEKKLLPGDILLEGSGGGPGKPVGRVARFEATEGVYLCSNFFRTLRPNQELVTNAFLAWRLQHFYTDPRIWCLQQQTTGIINLKYREYLATRIKIPPLAEQKRIAEILDTIDELIRKTEHIITKQQQMKQGLLHALITCGIDDNGELRDPVRFPNQFKDSPVGSIPRTWRTSAIESFLTSSVDGPFGSNLKTEHYVAEPGVRLVRLQNIGSGVFLDEEKSWIAESHARRLVKHDVRPGDVLVASLGDPTHPFARSCLYPEGHAPGIVKADCFRLRTSEELEGAFLSNLLNAPRWRKGLTRFVNRSGVSRDRVNLSKLRRYEIPVAPLPEQRAVVAVISAAEHHIASECEHLEKLVLLKRGLMQDLLSGRVRVTDDRPHSRRKEPLGQLGLEL